jgi:hypothetical protein
MFVSLILKNDTDLFILLKPRTGERPISNVATLPNFKILQVDEHKSSLFIISLYLRGKLQFS